MGSLCSKHNTHSGSQQILGGETAAGRRDYGSSADARAAAAAAAERRLKSGQARGTRAKAGRPATQQEASKSTRMASASTREEEPLVWD